MDDLLYGVLKCTMPVELLVALALVYHLGILRRWKPKPVFTRTKKWGVGSGFERLMSHAIVGFLPTIFDVIFSPIALLRFEKKEPRLEKVEQVLNQTVKRVTIVKNKTNEVVGRTEDRTISLEKKVEAVAESLEKSWEQYERMILPLVDKVAKLEFLTIPNAPKPKDWTNEASELRREIRDAVQGLENLRSQLPAIKLQLANLAALPEKNELSKLKERFEAGLSELHNLNLVLSDRMDAAVNNSKTRHDKAETATKYLSDAHIDRVKAQEVINAQISTRVSELVDTVTSQRTKTEARDKLIRESEQFVLSNADKVNARLDDLLARQNAVEGSMRTDVHQVRDMVTVRDRSVHARIDTVVHSIEGEIKELGKNVIARQNEHYDDQFRRIDALAEAVLHLKKANGPITSQLAEARGSNILDRLEKLEEMVTKGVTVVGGPIGAVEELGERLDTLEIEVREALGEQDAFVGEQEERISQLEGRADTAYAEVMTAYVNKQLAESQAKAVESSIEAKKTLEALTALAKGQPAPINWFDYFPATKPAVVAPSPSSEAPAQQEIRPSTYEELRHSWKWGKYPTLITNHTSDAVKAKANGWITHVEGGVVDVKYHDPDETLTPTAYTIIYPSAHSPDIYLVPPLAPANEAVLKAAKRDRDEIPF